MSANKTIKVIFPLAALAALAISIAIFAKREEEPVSSVLRTVPVMGTILEMKLYGNDEAKLNDAAEAAANRMRTLEGVFSIFGSGEAASLNQSASKAPFYCSDEMWFILNECKKYFEKSEGAFDVTIRPMMLLWGFYRKREGMPSEEEISETKKKIGFNKLILDEKNKSIFFENPDMSLDFGGIVKGYAVDEAIAKIAEKGVKSGFVNLGGDIRTLPEPPPGKNHYNIGVRDPLDKSGICAIAKIAGSRALATSGDYERYVILENKHLTHIIDPATGRPVENMLSVTVIAPDALSADALSTSVFIKGASLAEKLHKENPQIEFLIFRKDEGGKLVREKFGDSWQEADE